MSWRSNHANDRYHRQADQQQFQGTHGQAKTIIAPPLEQGFRKNGYKGNAQRPFTEQAAQQVWNPESGNKGIRCHPGTKKRSQYHIPNVAEDSAEQGRRPHHAGSTGDISVLTFFLVSGVGIHRVLTLRGRYNNP